MGVQSPSTLPTLATGISLEGIQRGYHRGFRTTIHLNQTNIHALVKVLYSSYEISVLSFWTYE
jgi:hypothetical protein